MHLNYYIEITLVISYKELPPQWNSLWCGEGAYLRKRYLLVRQQKELVGAKQLRLNRTNLSPFFQFQGPGSK